MTQNEAPTYEFQDAAFACLSASPPSLRKHFPRLIDLHCHLPFRIEERCTLYTHPLILSGDTYTISFTIQKHTPRFKTRQPYKVECVTEDGRCLHLLFFHGKAPFLQSLLPVGEQRFASGKVRLVKHTLQMIHPDYIGPLSEQKSWEGYFPLYRSPKGLSSRTLHNHIMRTLPLLKMLPEWQEAPSLSFYDALYILHTGQTDMTDRALQRLAFDDLLTHQVAFALIKRSQSKKEGIRCTKIVPTSTLVELPFSLTNGQIEALDSIYTDLAASSPMLRLLQGDVGSGKTIIGFVTMLQAHHNQYQSVFLAPTEVLAQQHYTSFCALCPFIDAALYTRSTKTHSLENLAQVSIVFGTHALLENKVRFNNLGVVIIDEQHRFGVNQRLKIMDKGVAKPNVLLMSATPIPRSLLLTLYGDMAVTSLREKPHGRKPITTAIVRGTRLEEVYSRLKEHLASGEQIYWICPLIDNDDDGNVTERAKVLSARFSKVGALHGQLSADKKKSIMEQFAKGHLRILVATTVIEVGVDVPNATVIVIENADKFGLSQLHQLRGRVGRSDKTSYCLLLYSDAITDAGKQRLSIIRNHTDGFHIAQEDLHLRGGGDLLGTQQSGMPSFVFFRLYEHNDIMASVQRYTQKLMHDDPTLRSTKGIALRTALHIFNKHKALTYMRSG